MGVTTARAAIALAAPATRLAPAVLTGPTPAVTVPTPTILTGPTPAVVPGLAPAVVSVPTPAVTVPTPTILTRPTPAVTVVVIVGGLAVLELRRVAVFAAVLGHVLADSAAAAVKRLVRTAATGALIRLTRRVCGVLRAPETVGDLTGPARQLLGRRDVVTRSVGTRAGGHLGQCGHLGRRGRRTARDLVGTDEPARHVKTLGQ
ncbi:hypothetical protein BU204_10480 [Actinophytocola xanthii]|uniref:Uncharacterized protein n=1 Tax=Actinophytocola xanthii TaxID=1912961 RepID=A0A1Q8CTL6_9PSEU|nr:hypothetical protein BU204_10480 [Actinophytocola xanthii]